MPTLQRLSFCSTYYVLRWPSPAYAIWIPCCFSHEFPTVYACFQRHLGLRSVFFGTGYSYLYSSINNHDRLLSELLSAPSTSKPSALISWYNCFHATLLAKFSLYWFPVLRQAAPRNNEMLETSGTEDPCLVMKMVQFKNSTNALSISLFSGTTAHGFGHGYAVPRTSSEALTGGDYASSIFTIPLEHALSATDVHTIQMLICNSIKVGGHDRSDLSLHSFDVKVNRTHVVRKLEASVFLAIVYDGYRARKDRRISAFLQSLSHIVQLRSLASLLRLR